MLDALIIGALAQSSLLIVDLPDDAVTAVIGPRSTWSVRRGAP